MSSFLSKQSFNENGEIEVFMKRRLILDQVDEEFESDPQNNMRPSIKGKARVKYETNALTKDDVMPFNSIEEAEEHVLEPFEVFDFISKPPLHDVPEEEKIFKHIHRAMANVASMSKRGFANTMVYHPSNQAFVDQVDEKLEEDLDYIAHDKMVENCVLVIYRGEEDIDQPLIYVEGHGLLVNNKLTDIINYGNFIRI